MEWIRIEDALPYKYDDVEVALNYDLEKPVEDYMIETGSGKITWSHSEDSEVTHWRKV